MSGCLLHPLPLKCSSQSLSSCESSRGQMSAHPLPTHTHTRSIPKGTVPFQVCMHRTDPAPKSNRWVTVKRPSLGFSETEVLREQTCSSKGYRLSSTPCFRWRDHALGPGARSPTQVSFLLYLPLPHCKFFPVPQWTLKLCE